MHLSSVGLRPFSRLSPTADLSHFSVWVPLHHATLEGVQRPIGSKHYKTLPSSIAFGSRMAEVTFLTLSGYQNEPYDGFIKHLTIVSITVKKFVNQ